MEDKAVYPGQEEEVIDLSDIVSDAGESAEDIVDLAETAIVSPAAEDDAILDLTDVAVPEEDMVLELTDVAIPADVEPLELTDKVEESEAPLSLSGERCEDELPFSDSAAASDEADGCEPREGEAVAPVTPEGEANAKSAAPEEKTQAVASSADVEACFVLAAEIDERVRALEDRFTAGSAELEKRLAEAESRCAELSAKVEELTRQAEEGVSRFLADEAFAAFLEERIALAVEARMPVPAEVEPEQNAPEFAAEAEEPVEAAAEAVAESEAASEESVEMPAEDVVEELAEELIPADGAEPVEEADADVSAEDEVIPADSEADDSEAPVESEPEPVAVSREAIIETIDEIASHVGELEERVAAWELRCEQEAALAAARVIREEIAAMRADAARAGR